MKTVIHLSDREKELIDWIAKKEGYTFPKSGKPHRSFLLRKIVLDYSGVYYKRYKQEQNQNEVQDD